VEQDRKVVRDSAETAKFTDQGMDDEIEELKKLIEEAERLEDCVKCKKCISILDALRKISIDARNELVQVDPQRLTEVLRLQQTAKIFDSVELVIRNTINRGQLALDQISPQED
jgi:hypothetical protein